ncbi:MAG: thiamine-phosphate kinase [Parvibaculum sp.]|uniref:thiamine-phosphate kinase n=1 Tax=Parvibaculum sp. TaxID=2024848 RepID=UPI002728B112|nr:thiamine-phosphate kinase [Parvibaculum sp.]MDO8840192.1 thiamine-phosphate kinase [Parvibaculum sp.]
MTPPDKAEAPDEFALIAELFVPLAASAPEALALKDDAALYTASPGHQTVLTVDAMVEGVHFLPDDPAECVARKLLRVNLSDLAAKGATPKGYLLVTAWREGTPLSWMRAFATGLATDQQIFAIALWGGDTVRTPGPPSFTLTAVGEVPAGTMLKRGGARVGDGIYVTGTIGDAALGLKVLQGGLEGLDRVRRDWLAGRYRLPEPRMAAGGALRGIASGALDVSDGLMADLGHLCAVSGVGARIELGRVPLSSAARAALALDGGLIEAIAGGGDDYEILFAAAPGREVEIADIAAETRTPIVRIGTVLPAAEGVNPVDGAGRPVAFKHLGYRHF